MLRRIWKDCYEYKRIIEILDDYWILNPDEAEVIVEMYFRHKNGEVQAKRIIWKNPNMQGERKATTPKKASNILKLSEVRRPSAIRKQLSTVDH